jgi:hypothetical protein
VIVTIDRSSTEPPFRSEERHSGKFDHARGRYEHEVIGFRQTQRSLMMPPPENIVAAAKHQIARVR